METQTAFKDWKTELHGICWIRILAPRTRINFKWIEIQI